MLKHLIVKEFIQIKRDKRMLPIIIIAPIIQLLLLGYAATVDVRDIPTAVCDQDVTARSRDYLSSLFESGYFVRVGDASSPAGLDRFLDRGDADLAVVVPRGFAREIDAGRSGSVQLLVNGTDTNAASVGLSYATQISARYASRLLAGRMASRGVFSLGVISLEDRVWYNPELKSRNYMVPAILAMILMIMTMLLTAMAIVREKEIGTIEQLVVTPVKRWQVVVGKLLPFVLIGLLDVLLVTGVATLWFAVPLKGSFLLLLALAVPFLLNTLGLGLFVSTVSATQQQAMMTVMFFIMLPFVYLSGFVFPIENMPQAMQTVTYLIPLRYFLTIVRGIFLKGVGLEVLWPDALALSLTGLLIVLVSISRFRKQIG